MGKKDSYWFRHDSSAGRGLKIRRLQYKYKHWGKGIYWDVVEVLREQEGYCYEYSEEALHALRELLGVPIEVKINDDTLSFTGCIEECINLGLLKLNNGKIHCPPLSKNMVKWESCKSNGSKGGRPGGKKPKKKPTKTITKEKKIKEDIIYFQDDIILNEKYTQWVSYLKERGKNPKKTTIEFQIKKLSKFSAEVAIEAIDRSITNGYIGLFPENINLKSNTHETEQPGGRLGKFISGK